MLANQNTNEERIFPDPTERSVAVKVAALREDQIAALASLVRVDFGRMHVRDVAQEIVRDGLMSGHLATIIGEANLLEDLEWWVTYLRR